MKASVVNAVIGCVFIFSVLGLVTALNRKKATNLVGLVVIILLLLASVPVTQAVRAVLEWAVE